MRDFLSKIKDFFSRLITADPGSPLCIEQQDENGEVVQLFPWNEPIDVHTHWLIPIENMRYNGLSLVVEDADYFVASFTTEEINTWHVKNAEGKIIIGPFNRATCDHQYLIPSEIRHLISCYCNDGRYFLVVNGRAVAVKVVSQW